MRKTITGRQICNISSPGQAVKSNIFP